jgi:hypothetical protein
MKVKTKHFPVENRPTNRLLLYVGITCDYENRMLYHERYARWWSEAVDFKTEVFQNRRLARTAEWKAIKAENPSDNCHEKLAPPRRIAASYDYYP